MEIVVLHASTHSYREYAAMVLTGQGGQDSLGWFVLSCFNWEQLRKGVLHCSQQRSVLIHAIAYAYIVHQPGRWRTLRICGISRTDFGQTKLSGSCTPTYTFKNNLELISNWISQLNLHSCPCASCSQQQRRLWCNARWVQLLAEKS